MTRNVLFLTLLVSGASAAVFQDDPLSFQSTNEQTQVLELFTSQGCSSCPPAERWISQLVDHPGLWTEIVPIVYHVDYWDSLGWKDPFAKKAYTEKQYSYAEQGRIRQVYTPCFVSNGREWRGYFNRESLPKESSVAGILSAELQGDRLKVNYSEKEPLSLQVSILGFDLETQVSKGENRGRRLNQQFVTIHQSTHSSQSGNWGLRLPDFPEREDARYAIALVVTRKGKQVPLQSTGAWLDPISE